MAHVSSLPTLSIVLLGVLLVASAAGAGVVPTIEWDADSPGGGMSWESHIPSGDALNDLTWNGAGVTLNTASGDGPLMTDSFHFDGVDFGTSSSPRFFVPSMTTVDACLEVVFFADTTGNEMPVEFGESTRGIHLRLQGASVVGSMVADGATVTATVDVSGMNHSQYKLAMLCMDIAQNPSALTLHVVDSSEIAASDTSSTLVSVSEWAGPEDSGVGGISTTIGGDDGGCAGCMPTNGEIHSIALHCQIVSGVQAASRYASQVPVEIRSFTID